MVTLRFMTSRCPKTLGRLSGTVSGNSSVYTWLYRIVVNVCLMKIRSQRRVRIVPLDDLLPPRDEHGRLEHLAL